MGLVIPEPEMVHSELDQVAIGILLLSTGFGVTSLQLWLPMLIAARVPIPQSYACVSEVRLTMGSRLLHQESPYGKSFRTRTAHAAKLQPLRFWL